MKANGPQVVSLLKTEKSIEKLKPNLFFLLNKYFLKNHFAVLWQQV